jgi:hypothetical protein
MNGWFDIHATLPSGAPTEQVPRCSAARRPLQADGHARRRINTVYALMGEGRAKLVESPPDRRRATLPRRSVPSVCRPRSSGLIGRDRPRRSTVAGAFTIAGGGVGQFLCR